jgi:predicted esterase
MIYFRILGLTAAIQACVGCAAPASTGPADGGTAPSDAAAKAFVVPEFCAASGPGLVDVTSTPAGTYFVHHPTSGAGLDVGSRDVFTIVFIPGGPGSKATAKATYEQWLSRGADLGKYRVVVPYAADGDLTNESERLIDVLDEVLACYGGDANKVHLGGTSNGGRAAFSLMLKHSDRFVTLLGAPGLFASVTDMQLKDTLAGKAVFNGAGELDDGWRQQVQATHSRLKGLGLDSEYVELPGQGHILDPRANQEPFFQFWATHAK